MEKKFTKFSVPLGLLDYINPILYTVTMATILCHTRGEMPPLYWHLMHAGAVISIIAGFAIPTGKVLVGLEVIRFRMPVSLVFCVNAGILVSGLMLFRFVTCLSPVVTVILFGLIAAFLALVYRKQKKLNTIAVLTGAFGYLLLYASLITLAVRGGIVLPVVLYALAILLFVMLCGIGIRADLKNPKVHWVIEASNVLCQLLVAVGTLILYS